MTVTETTFFGCGHAKLTFNRSVPTLPLLFLLTLGSKHTGTKKVSWTKKFYKKKREKWETDVAADQRGPNERTNALKRSDKMPEWMLVKVKIKATQLILSYLSLFNKKERPGHVDWLWLCIHQMCTVFEKSKSLWFLIFSSCITLFFNIKYLLSRFLFCNVCKVKLKKKQT